MQWDLRGPTRRTKSVAWRGENPGRDAERSVEKRRDRVAARVESCCECQRSKSRGREGKVEDQLGMNGGRRIRHRYRSRARLRSGGRSLDWSEAPPDPTRPYARVQPDRDHKTPNSSTSRGRDRLSEEDPPPCPLLRARKRERKQTNLITQRRRAWACLKLSKEVCWARWERPAETRPQRLIDGVMEIALQFGGADDAAPCSDE